MPLTSKGQEIKAAMEKEYGSEKGEQVFYASRNKGTITGVDALPETAGGVEPARPVPPPNAAGSFGAGDYHDGAEPKDDLRESATPVTAASLAEISERNRRYWEQLGGSFKEND